MAEECNPEDVLRGIRDGTLQLWTSPGAAIVTEVIQYPRCKVIYLTLAGGDIEELKAMEALVAGWARDIGCARAEIICGRPWHRILGGYQEIGLRLVQRL